ncbi:hypothetical protein D1872_282550 [compost metagenome]
MHSDIPDIISVDQNGSARRIVKPAEQIDDRAFTRAGMTYQRDGLPRPNRQIDASQGGTTGFVLENHPPESDIPPDRRQHHRIRFVGDIGFFVHKLEDALRGGHSDQQLIVHLAQPVYGVPEISDVVAESNQKTDRQLTGLN